ncbi:hypothetical protein HON49_04160 [archaeon]|jgi:hypothetical protein|nr:hypothetical protein [archaeon]
MGLASWMISAIITVVVFILSALPLYFAVKFLGGKGSLVKVLFVSLISGLIISAIKETFKWGWLLAFFVLIWIYHETFRLKWWKASIVWIVQLGFFLVLTFLATLLVLAVTGISIALI